jgi:ribose-phosphate pyrophosphokinase
MVKNIVVLGGNSHPELVERICASLGLSPCSRILTKFSGGETRCEVQDSVRGKDVYIIQTGAGKVNDVLMDLLIMISALKTGADPDSLILDFADSSRICEKSYGCLASVPLLSTA